MTSLTYEQKKSIQEVKNFLLDGISYCDEALDGIDVDANLSYLITDLKADTFHSDGTYLSGLVSRLEDIQGEMEN